MKMKFTDPLTLDGKPEELAAFLVHFQSMMAAAQEKALNFSVDQLLDSLLHGNENSNAKRGELDG